MTLTAVDNPLYPAGADRTSGEATGKKSNYHGEHDVFLKLLETTAVHQVAYTKGREEFEETLELHDETTTRENRPDDKRNKYDAIGLLDQKEQASQGSGEIATKGEDTGDDAPQGPVAALGQNSGLEQQRQATPDAASGDDEAAVLAALGLPSTPAIVAEPKASPTAGGRKEAATSQSHGNLPKGLEVASATAAGSKEKAAEALDRARTNAESRLAGTPSGKANGGVEVKQTPADIVSQPASALTASAALTAQASRPGQAPFEAPVVPAEDLGTGGRPTLLDGSNGRANGRPQTNAVQPQAKPQVVSTGPEGQQANTGQQAAAAVPVNPQPVLTAPAARAEVVVQSSQPVGDPVAGSSATNNSGQAHRSQPQAPAQPPKPPVRPDQLTGQVAVQIKKAIGQGSDHIRIQLKPAELGRVEIKLEVNDKGHAVAVVTADRADTLDLLQRDASGLRQALQEAGLSTDSNSLSFNLRGEGGKFGQEMADRGHAPQGGTDTGAGEADTSDAAMIADQDVISDGHVNVQI